ncbi:hypothetical protein [Paraburkholderia fungorum]|nr:hypothetical protein [Paraburkholderia fungorum]
MDRSYLFLGPAFRRRKPSIRTAAKNEKATVVLVALHAVNAK